MADDIPVHPNRTRHNPPDQEQIDAARARQLGTSVDMRATMADPQSAEVQDRRSINLDPNAPPSPSADDPPEIVEIGQFAAPAGGYDADKRYLVTLIANATVAGRVLTPAAQHLVTGEVATAISSSIGDASEWTP